MAGLMNEAISQLLVLQDRDSKATRLEAELESIDPEREKTRRESLQAQQVLEQAKQAQWCRPSVSALRRDQFQQTDVSQILP